MVYKVVEKCNTLQEEMAYIVYIAGGSYFNKTICKNQAMSDRLCLYYMIIWRWRRQCWKRRSGGQSYKKRVPSKLTKRSLKGWTARLWLLSQRADTCSILSLGSSMCMLRWIAKGTVKHSLLQIEKINLKLTERDAHDILIIKTRVYHVCRLEQKNLYQHVLVENS